MFGRSSFTGALVVVALAASVPAQAAVINFGLNIATDGTGTQAGFFDGDDFGVNLDSNPSSLDRTINTLGVNSGGATWSWAGKTITSFDFFIDATDLSSSDDFDVYFRDGGDWRNVGSLVSNSGTNTDIPVITGGRKDRVDNDDVDNTFFLQSSTTPYNFFNDITAGSFRFKIVRDGNNDEVRIDGVNLQVVYTVDPQDPMDVPEPTSLALVGLALVGAARLRRRR